MSRIRADQYERGELASRRAGTRIREIRGFTFSSQSRTPHSVNYGPSVKSNQRQTAPCFAFSRNIFQKMSNASRSCALLYRAPKNLPPLARAGKGGRVALAANKKTKLGA